MTADMQRGPARNALALGVLGFLGLSCGAVEAAVRIEGQVQAGGGPVANSTVTLWAGSAGEPKQLAQTKTAPDGSFAIGADETPGPGVSLYLIAKGGAPSVNKGGGDNPALAFLSGAGPHASCQGRHQRDDDDRFGLDQRTVPRWRGDQRSRA